MLEILKTIPQTSNGRRIHSFLTKLLSKVLDSYTVTYIGCKPSDINKKMDTVRALLSSLDINIDCLGSA